MVVKAFKLIGFSPDIHMECEGIRARHNNFNTLNELCVGLIKFNCNYQHLSAVQSAD